MTNSDRPAASDYGIHVEPWPGEVTARRGGAVLAHTKRARVMFETRLAPAVYFPLDDLRVPLSDPGPLQTFCPFKGTALYRSLVVDGSEIENAVWSYEEALPEARDVAGHVGFMPAAGAQLVFSGPEPVAGDVSNLSGPLIDWLLLEAGAEPDAESLTRALAGKLGAHGIPVSRLSVMIWSLHPLIVGRNVVWERDGDNLSSFAPSYELHSHPAFTQSPLRHVSEGLGGVRQRLGTGEGGWAFPILDDLRAKGATDYVAMPLKFSDGQVNVLTLTTDAPGGFTTADLGLIFEVSTVLGRFYEVFNQRDNARSLLETYVGKRSGARVLGGEIRRGDGDEIDAAIMFCDLRGSTRLAEEMGRAEYLALLNGFFETVATHVEAEDGEVLKFIGDAVLAVFDANGDAMSASRRALRAAQAISAAFDVDAEQGDTPCDCAIGLAFGQVMHGNVGSRARLDFTVIGGAANIAARLADHGKTIGQRVVVTEDIARACDAGRPLGKVALRNVADPVACYAAA